MGEMGLTTKVMEFLAVLHAGDDVFAPFVVDGLRDVVRCDIAAYRRLVPGEDGEFTTLEVTSGVDMDVAAPLWDRYQDIWQGDPLPGLGYEGRTPRVPRGLALRSSDVISDRRFQTSAFYAEMCRPLGTRYVLKLFADSGDDTVGFVLESSRRDFSDDDVTLLTALAPHFEIAHRRQSAPRPSVAVLDRLSAREVEVAALVGRGLTNAEIAATLFVAVGTVRKHLDNIYARTGVHNRTALARLVLTCESNEATA